ncbi:MAG: DNA-protecting protein DprA [Myxococcales bacterium]|nr:DNA-protecting protein DprA [Myxococcales bacterium]
MTQDSPRAESLSYERVEPADLGFETRLSPARVTELNVRGSLVALEPPLVAIVGTRHPDGEGLAMARSLAEACARRGVTTLSGGALGIDAAVHAATLEHRGRTVVVLPSGLDKPYPLRHRAMYSRIVSFGGALVSMFRDDTPPTKWTFPRRNELLSSLCDVLVLVQAPSSSGALLAAAFAQKIGRRVLVVPASPGDRRGAGCLAMLRGGAAVCSSAEDVFEALEARDGPLLARASVARSPARTRARASTRAASAGQDEAATERASTIAIEDVPLDPAQRRCVDAVADGPLHPDSIATRASLDSATTRGALVTLVLLGVLVERSDGTFARSRA